MAPSRTLFHRGGAGLLACLYAATNVLFPHAAEAGFWEERRQAAAQPSSAAARSDGDSVAFLPQARPAPLGAAPAATVSGGMTLEGDAAAGPSSTRLDPRFQPVLAAVALHGVLRETHLSQNPDAPLVVHIQDAHGVLEAQRNIGAMIDALSPQSPLVAVEGAAGGFDLDAFRAWPDRAAVRDVADYLLKEGAITGPEFSGLTSEKEPFLWGVEDMPLYRRHVRALVEARRLKPAMDAALASFRSRAAALKARVYSDALRAYDADLAGFSVRSVDLAAHVETLFSAAPGRWTPGPNLLLLRQAFAAEKSLDFKEVERQRGLLVRRLAAALDKPALDDLLRRSLDLRDGRAAYGAYHARLRALCREKGIDLRAYGPLNAYLDYVALSERIDRNALLDEISAAERAVGDALAAAPEQKRLLAACRRLALVEKLSAQAMTPADWRAYDADRDGVLRLPEDLDAQVTGLPGLLAPFEEFCRAAVARNAAFVDNLARKLGDGKTAVLVTGGFHTEGLSRLLGEKGFSYVVVTPKITEVPRDNDYLDVFVRDTLPMEKLFAGDAVHLEFLQALSRVAPEEGGRFARVSARVRNWAWMVLKAVRFHRREYMGGAPGKFAEPSSSGTASFGGVPVAFGVSWRGRLAARWNGVLSWLGAHREWEDHYLLAAAAWEAAGVVRHFPAWAVAAPLLFFISLHLPGVLNRYRQAAAFKPGWSRWSAAAWWIGTSLNLAWRALLLQGAQLLPAPRGVWHDRLNAGTGGRALSLRSFGVPIALAWEAVPLTAVKPPEQTWEAARLASKNLSPAEERAVLAEIVRFLNGQMSLSLRQTSLVTEFPQVRMNRFKTEALEAHSTWLKSLTSVERMEWQRKAVEAGRSLEAHLPLLQEKFKTSAQKDFLAGEFSRIAPRFAAFEKGREAELSAAPAPSAAASAAPAASAPAVAPSETRGMSPSDMRGAVVQRLVHDLSEKGWTLNQLINLFGADGGTISRILAKSPQSPSGAQAADFQALLSRARDAVENPPGKGSERAADDLGKFLPRTSVFRAVSLGSEELEGRRKPQAAARSVEKAVSEASAPELEDLRRLEADGGIDLSPKRNAFVAIEAISGYLKDPAVTEVMRQAGLTGPLMSLRALLEPIRQGKTARVSVGGALCVVSLKRLAEGRDAFHFPSTGRSLSSFTVRSEGRITIYYSDLAGLLKQGLLSAVLPSQDVPEGRREALAAAAERLPETSVGGKAGGAEARPGKVRRGSPLKNFLFEWAWDLFHLPREGESGWARTYRATTGIVGALAETAALQVLMTAPTGPAAQWMAVGMANISAGLLVLALIREKITLGEFARRFTAGAASLMAAVLLARASSPGTAWMTAGVFALAHADAWMDAVRARDADEKELPLHQLAVRRLGWFLLTVGWRFGAGWLFAGFLKTSGLDYRLNMAWSTASHGALNRWGVPWLRGRLPKAVPWGRLTPAELEVLSTKMNLASESLGQFGTNVFESYMTPIRRLTKGRRSGLPSALALRLKTLEEAAGILLDPSYYVSRPLVFKRLENTSLRLTKDDFDRAVVSAGGPQVLFYGNWPEVKVRLEGTPDGTPEITLKPGGPRIIVGIRAGAAVLSDEQGRVIARSSLPASGLQWIHSSIQIVEKKPAPESTDEPVFLLEVSDLGSDTGTSVGVPGKIEKWARLNARADRWARKAEELKPRARVLKDSPWRPKDWSSSPIPLEHDDPGIAVDRLIQAFQGAVVMPKAYWRMDSYESALEDLERRLQEGIDRSKSRFEWEEQGVGFKLRKLAAHSPNEAERLGKNADRVAGRIRRALSGETSFVSGGRALKAEWQEIRQEVTRAWNLEWEEALRKVMYFPEKEAAVNESLWNLKTEIWAMSEARVRADRNIFDILSMAGRVDERGVLVLRPLERTEEPAGDEFLLTVNPKDLRAGYVDLSVLPDLAAATIVRYNDRADLLHVFFSADIFQSLQHMNDADALLDRFAGDAGGQSAGLGALKGYVFGPADVPPLERLSRSEESLRKARAYLGAARPDLDEKKVLLAAQACVWLSLPFEAKEDLYKFFDGEYSIDDAMELIRGSMISGTTDTWAAPDAIRSMLARFLSLYQGKDVALQRPAEWEAYREVFFKKTAPFESGAAGDDVARPANLVFSWTGWRKASAAWMSFEILGTVLGASAVYRVSGDTVIAGLGLPAAPLAWAGISVVLSALHTLGEWLRGEREGAWGDFFMRLAVFLPYALVAAPLSPMALVAAGLHLFYDAVEMRPRRQPSTREIEAAAHRFAGTGETAALDDLILAVGRATPRLPRVEAAPSQAWGLEESDRRFFERMDPRARAGLGRVLAAARSAGVRDLAGLGRQLRRGVLLAAELPRVREALKTPGAFSEVDATGLESPEGSDAHEAVRALLAALALERDPAHSTYIGAGGLGADGAHRLLAGAGISFPASAKFVDNPVRGEAFVATPTALAAQKAGASSLAVFTGLKVDATGAPIRVDPHPLTLEQAVEDALREAARVLTQA